MECWELLGPFGDPGLMKNHHLGLMYGNINPAVTGIIVALMNEAIRGNYCLQFVSCCLRSSDVYRVVWSILKNKVDIIQGALAFCDFKIRGPH